MPVEPGAMRPTTRHLKPTWWWFMIHGLLAVVFGAYALLMPLTGASGFLRNGVALAILCVLAGAQVTLQALESRGLVRGWVMLLITALHSIAAGIAFLVISLLGLPYVLFWSMVSFLIVVGAMLEVGLLSSPAYRMWGILMGSCLVATAVLLMLAWLADPSHSFDIPSVGMGVGGLLYGVAVFVGALQARAVHYRAEQPRRP